MPSKVYNNVEDYRLIDNGRVVEDVQNVSLPTITRTSTSIDAAGMVAAVDVPSSYHVDAMDFSIAHNNGVNCQQLSAPGQHTMEFRIARQRYNVIVGDFEYESVKYRVVGVHKSTDQGSVERGNPLGSTENYSVLRFEKEVGGEVVTLIDARTGDNRSNGVDYASPVQSLLN